MTSTLLPSQKNEMFRAIEHRGLEPSAFHWGEVSLRRRGQSQEFSVPALVHSASQFYFGFGGRGGGGDFIIYFSPDPRGHGWDPSETWYSVMSWLDTWLANLRHELNQRDLWSELVTQRSALQTAPSADDNSPFSPEERAQIAETLARVEAQVSKSMSLSVQQAAALHAKLEELRQSAGRLGRKDWGMYALGTLTSLIMEAMFSPDQARAIVQQITQALSWLAAHVPRLTP